MMRQTETAFIHGVVDVEPGERQYLRAFFQPRFFDPSAGYDFS